MIPKSLQDLTPADLDSLISEGVPESATLDYKRQFPAFDAGDASDVLQAKAEFAADVTAFANTHGGDLVYGVEESAGLPTRICGVQIDDYEKLTRRLQQILREHVEPRIPSVEFSRPIAIGDGRSALVLRVRKSWGGPHRVKNRSKFYGRSAAEKFELDVSQLRAAFLLTEEVPEKIRNFRIERVMRIESGETPVPITDRPRFIFHLIPLSAFTTRDTFDVVGSTRELRRLPLYGSGSQPGSDNPCDRLNLEGLVAHGVPQDGTINTYLQVFRTGAIEHVYTESIGKRSFPPALERFLVASLPTYLSQLKRVGFQPPFYVFLSLTRVKDMWLYKGHLNGFEKSTRTFGRNDLLLPESIIESHDSPAYSILKPLFDLIWNAAGEPETKYFDADGKFLIPTAPGE